MRQRRAMRRADFLGQTTPVHHRAPLSRVLWEWVAQPIWRTASSAWHESDALGDEDAWRRMHGEWVLLDNVEVRRPYSRSKLPSCSATRRHSARTGCSTVCCRAPSCTRSLRHCATHMATRA